MADGITTQRGNQYTRTLEATLTDDGDLTTTVVAPAVTVTVSGDGDVDLTVQCHPATATLLGIRDSDGPDPNSEHWCDAAPDDPLTGTVAPGQALIADYGASGLFWWRTRLNSGGPVKVFMSVAGSEL